MENFRQFEVGPDPFGRTWLAQFMWLQTAISLRHSDSVDAKFRLVSRDSVVEKVVVLMHPDLRSLSEKLGRPLTDPWCSRLAALHLKHMIETGEDLEKEHLTASPQQLAGYAEELRKRLAKVVSGIPDSVRGSWLKLLPESSSAFVVKWLLSLHFACWPSICSDPGEVTPHETLSSGIGAGSDFQRSRKI